MERTHLIVGKPRTPDKPYVPGEDCANCGEPLTFTPSGRMAIDTLPPGPRTYTCDGCALQVAACVEPLDQLRITPQGLSDSMQPEFEAGIHKLLQIITRRKDN